MNKKQRNMLTRIIIALVMTIALQFIDATGWILLGLYLVVYIIIGGDILKKAWSGVNCTPKVGHKTFGVRYV